VAASPFAPWGGEWVIEAENFVQMPVAKGPLSFLDFVQTPDFTQLFNPAMYTAGLTIAVAASIGTLLNLESVDKLDPLQRTSPPNRELFAQGIGNVMAGMIGGIPITSEIVRGSVNVNAGAKTEFATIIHGMLLLTSIVFFPRILNMIPLSCLAAILLVTGARLIGPRLFVQIWSSGRYQIIPFVLTVVAIVFTDLLLGVLIGLVASLAFILNSNLRRPIRRAVEKHLGGEVLHIELANQVSFLNRAALTRIVDNVPIGGSVLLNAENTDYIDPDILDLIRDFKQLKAPARRITVSLNGFKEKYQLQDQVKYVDYSTRELQSAVTPSQVLRIIKEGHERFRSGQQLTRDLSRQVKATAEGQHPLAVILSCIDSRIPIEHIFDLGVGDVFSVRVAGNIISPEILGSIEYACEGAGAKLILVMGHTQCGAVTAAVNQLLSPQANSRIGECTHLESIVNALQQSIDQTIGNSVELVQLYERTQIVNAVSRRNVANSAETIRSRSGVLRGLESSKRLMIASAMYDVSSGSIEFLEPLAASQYD
jgi:carbonic anhydrase